MRQKLPAVGGASSWAQVSSHLVQLLKLLLTIAQLLVQTAA